VSAGEPTNIEGWAWSDAGVTRIEVSVDGGENWEAAKHAGRPDFSWQHSCLSWTFRAGEHHIFCRCIDARGVGVTDRRYGAIPGSAYWRHLMIGA
jgi:hypothetical protein